MKSWKSFALGAALVAAPVQPQDAPQQTVEGAQEFLRLISTQFSMANSAMPPGAATFGYVDIRFEPESACTSSIGSKLTWTINNDRSDPNQSNDENFEQYKAVMTRGWTDAASIANWHKQMEPHRFRTSVDWSSVSSVQKVSAKTYGAPDDVKRAVLINSQPAFVIFAPDEALATRLAYAMEFLRAACDRSAETGF